MAENPVRHLRRRKIKRALFLIMLGLFTSLITALALSLLVPYRTLPRGFADHESAFTHPRPDGDGDMYLLSNEQLGSSFAHTLVPSGRIVPQGVSTVPGDALAESPAWAREFLWPWVLWPRVSELTPLPTTGGTDWRAVMGFGLPMRCLWLAYRPVKPLAGSPHIAINAIELSTDHPMWWPRAIPFGLRARGLVFNTLFFATAWATLFALARAASRPAAFASTRAILATCAAALLLGAAASMLIAVAARFPQERIHLWPSGSYVERLADPAGRGHLALSVRGGFGVTHIESEADNTPSAYTTPGQPEEGTPWWADRVAWPWLHGDAPWPASGQSDARYLSGYGLPMRCLLRDGDNWQPLWTGWLINSVLWGTGFMALLRGVLRLKAR